MTVLNFPASPNQGDTYTVNNVLYTYEGVKWTANNPSNLSSEYVNITGDTMTGTLTVPALVSTGDITANKNITAASYNTSQLAGFRNQLINGNMLINQRGSVNTTTAGVTEVYTCDRWYVDSAGTYSWEQRNPSNANWNVGFTAAGFDTCLNVRNAQSSYRIRQAIELPVVGQPGQFVPGSTWNVSIYATDQPTVTVDFRTSVTGAAGDVVPVLTETLMPAVPGESMRYSYSFTVPSNITLVSTNNCLAVSFRNSSGTGAISVSGVQLEPGTVATPYEQIPYQTQLANCQRYYQSISIDSPDYPTFGQNTIIIAGGVATGPDTANFAFNLVTTVPLRKSPTLSFSTLKLYETTYGANQVTVTAAYWAKGGLSLTAVGAFANSPRPATFKATGAGSYVSFDAEL